VTGWNYVIIVTMYNSLERLGRHDISHMEGSVTIHGLLLLSYSKEKKSHKIRGESYFYYG
jgi:hypothetical protein